MCRVLLVSGIDQQGTRSQNTAVTTVSLLAISFVVFRNSQTSLELLIIWLLCLPIRSAGVSSCAAQR